MKKNIVVRSCWTEEGYICDVIVKRSETKKEKQ